MIRTLISLVATAAFGLILSPAPASAEAFQQTVSVEVAYDDIDPSTVAGAKALLGRMQRAARTVCGGASGFAHLAFQRQRTACKRDAMARAVASLDEPMVSALLERRNPVTVLAAR